MICNLVSQITAWPDWHGQVANEGHFSILFIKGAQPVWSKVIIVEIVISSTYFLPSLYCKPLGPINIFFWPCLHYHQNFLSQVFLYHQIFCQDFSTPIFFI